MAIIIVNISALEFWRSGDPVAMDRPKLSSVRKSQFVKFDKASDYMDNLQHVQAPLEILVPSAAVRWETEFLQFHVHSQLLPEHSLVRINGNGFVASPEMCFLELGARIQLVKLIEIGCEFCGTYAKAEYLDDGMYRRAPLATPQIIQAFVCSAVGEYGAKVAKIAAKYVAAGSASPTETIVYLLLCLPCSLGGYGLPVPNLNHHVGIRKFERRFASKQYYKCDMCWPEFDVTLEYDSNKEHTGPVKITKDAQKRNALLAMGKTTVTVTWRQLYNEKEFDKVAKIVAKLIGFRIRPRSAEFAQKRRELRLTLLRDRRWWG